MTDNIPNENRKEPRIGLEIKIRLTPLKTNSNIYGWVQDLSRGGFKLKTDSPLELKDTLQEGDRVKFQTYEDFFNFKGHGGIVWMSIGDNTVVGIKFDDIDDESKKSLEEFLEVCLDQDG
jgi:hypothetical protein